jgi:hypothetical protein
MIKVVTMCKCIFFALVIIGITRTRLRRKFETPRNASASTTARRLARIKIAMLAAAWGVLTIVSLFKHLGNLFLKNLF